MSTITVTNDPQDGSVTLEAEGMSCSAPTLAAAKEALLKGIAMGAIANMFVNGIAGLAGGSEPLTLGFTPDAELYFNRYKAIQRDLEAL